MGKGRLEAFSDGVIAILITIMVLELPQPQGVTLTSLAPFFPKLLIYLISFVLLGIYWNNHHHLLQASQRVNGSVLWANLHLLFWLSLVPWVTAWAGDHAQVSLPVSVYGVVMFLAGAAYYVLVQALLASHPPDWHLASAVRTDAKGLLSLLIYACGVLGSFFNPLLGWALYVTVALIWLVPDRRIERALGE